MKLYEWQEADVDRLEENGFIGLLNIEPGGTKTILSLAAHVRSGSQVTLVVAPKNTFRTAWIEDAEEFFGFTPRVVGNGRKAEREAFDDFRWGYPGVYLISPQLLTRSDVDEWRMDMCVVDEGHKLNRAGAKGQKQLDKLAERSTMRLFLSGTAWRNSFTRAWATMRFLWPWLDGRGEVAHRNHWVWCRDRMSSEQIYTNQRDQFGRPKKVTKWLHEEEPGRLLSEAPCVITHKKRERCCEWHPNGFLDLVEPQVITREVPLNRAQKRIIEELEDQGLAWLEENPLVVQLPMNLQQRIRQVCLGVPEVESWFDEEAEVHRSRVWFEDGCSSPFADELEELLEELDGEPVAVYLESQSFASVLTARLNKNGFRAFEFSGQTTRDRDDNLDRFGDEFQVMVGVISAVGEGTDGIQKRCKTEVWLERHVDEVLNVQTESRADRLGGLGQVQRYYFVDDLGFAEGRLGKQLEERLRLNESLRAV